MKIAARIIVFYFLFSVQLLPAATSYRLNNTQSQTITEHSVCRNVTNNSGADKFIPTNTSTEWANFYNNPPAGVTVGSCCGGSFTVSANASNINLFTIAGSPTCTSGNWTITINSGIVIDSTSSASASVVTGTWPAGSTVTLVNNGNIYGKGGDGGAGGTNNGVGSPGGAGGDAISLGANLTINNGSGNIFGGGGGGGGGGACETSFRGAPSNYFLGAGGGGGGQGSNSSTGGAGGNGYSANDGTAGGPGTTSGGGTAGSGHNTGAYGRAGNGAVGAAWGTAAANGSNSSGCALSNRAGGAGGAAGRAIRLNGFSANITAGNNGTQVRGSVL